jgi:uncharacterized protein YndB with AHSA1/START domain
MLRKLVYLVLALAVVAAGVVGYAATQPDSFSVSRSTTIAAPPEKIFPLLTDFKAWQTWSPWEGRDPAMKRELSGAESGVGAVYAWDGNSDVGQGRMEITEATAPSKVVVKLDFLRPIEAHNMVDFALTPRDGGTDVTWTMNGPQPLIAKVFGLFMDMDGMIGGDFEAGLAKLKAAAET